MNALSSRANRRESTKKSSLPGKPKSTSKATKKSSSKKSGITGSKSIISGSKSTICNKDIDKYVQRLKAVGALPELDTSPRDNELVSSFLKVAANDPSVTKIKIDGDPRFSHISPSILLDFAEGIRLNCHLTKMEICNVLLGNTFLSALADSIKDNLTLTHIDLRHNGFTSDALVEFCLAMSGNESLRYVDLRMQRAPVSTQQEQAVVDALEKNVHVQNFEIEFRSHKCQKSLEKILNRNKTKNKTIANVEQKLVELYRKECHEAEEAFKAREVQAKEAHKEIGEKDYQYFQELSALAKKYKVDLTTTEDSQKKEPAAPVVLKKFSAPVNSGSVKDSLNNIFARGPPKMAATCEKVEKGLSSSIPSENMTANGSFLTNEYINAYLVDDEKDKTLTFEFTNQFKLFKRFAPDDPARKLIVTKFVDTLVNHPRSNEFNILNMANTCVGDDFLVYFSEKCLTGKKLPNLHQLNLETNLIQGPGIVAMSKCIASPDVWKYLQAVKLDNQRSLVKTKAEMALANALAVNCSVVRFSMRIRNLAERERSNKCIQRNIDFLRQARMWHAKKSGTPIKRSRNKMEQLIDKIAANDPSVKGDVSIVADQTFLALNHVEKVKAGSCFNNNEHVTNVKLNMLKLDDEFAIEMGKSVANNSTIEKLDLDGNAITGDGITAILAGLAKNKSIIEFQVRHQSKPMASTDEEKLVGLLKDNETLIKFGVDLRTAHVRTQLDRKIRQNQDLRRKNRCSAKKSTSDPSGIATASSAAVSNSKAKIKSVETENLLKRVEANDSKVIEVKLQGDKEFIQMASSRKAEFFKGLRKNTTVATLTLDNVELDNKFAEEEFASIMENTTLQTISVNQNNFTSPGVLAIAKAASSKKQVRRLSVLKPRFKITNEDADLLLSAMEDCSYLHDLDIQFRDKKYAERLEQVLSRNRSKYP